MHNTATIAIRQGPSVYIMEETFHDAQNSQLIIAFLSCIMCRMITTTTLRMNSLEWMADVLCMLSKLTSNFHWQITHMHARMHAHTQHTVGQTHMHIHKYSTLHKKLCESSWIASPWFASVATRINFALFTTAWQTMLCEVWLHGRVYGFLTTRD